MKILIGILIIFVIIVSHETGHLLIAKMSGIPVREFTIGFGPKLCGFTKGGTLYCIRLIPLGGACMFDDPENPNPEDSQFRKAPIGSRIATIAAGPIFNFLLAFILGLFMMSKTYIPSAQVIDVDPAGVAYEAGMRAGDTILKVNGSRTYMYPEVSLAISMGYGKPLKVEYEHEGQKHSVMMTPRMNEEYGQFMIGVTFGAEMPERTPITVIRDSFHYVRYMIKMTITGVKMLVTGQFGLQDLSGPVGIVDLVSDEYDAAQKTDTGVGTIILSMLNITLLLSANLGVMNLLPFPVLDGGRLIFLIIEAVRRKPVSIKIENAVNFVGVILLLMLAVAVMFSDVMKLFG